jgi:hypothetical protein
MIRVVFESALENSAGVIILLVPIVCTAQIMAVGDVDRILLV